MIDFSSVKAIVIPEGNVSSIQIGGVMVWSSVPDAPTVSISADGTTYSYSVTLNSSNDPVRYRVQEWAPDGTCVYDTDWTMSTNNVSSSLGLYSYTESVTIEAYSYRGSAVSDTVSDSATPSRTPYIDAPSVSVTVDVNGMATVTVSGDDETTTVYWSITAENDLGGTYDVDSGTGSISTHVDATTIDPDITWIQVNCSAYAEAYGITSDTVSDSDTWTI